MHWPKCETLKLEDRHGWLTIWLNRPDQRNAMSRAMTAELSDVLTRARGRTDLRGIALRGAGGTFCAGGDLTEFRTDFQTSIPDRSQIESASRAAGTLFRTLNTMPQVTVALIEGAAMAGGLGLMCACDISIATEDARFALTETTLGIPPAQIAPLVRARTGLATARRIMLTAPRFDAAQALALGLVTTVVDDAAALEDEVRDLRSQVRRCAPGAIAATKDVLLDTPDTEAQIDRAARAFADCIVSEEGREGILAFFEKRPARWAAEPPTEPTR